MNRDSLGDRMKNNYENAQRHYLTKRMPTIIRVDGKAFHSFTKGFQRPFDPVFVEAMWETAKYLCENIMGCKIAYVQSDEITLLLTDYDTLTTQSWFDKNVTKMVSVSASMATMAFNQAFSNCYWNFSHDTYCWMDDKKEGKDYVEPMDRKYREKVCESYSKAMNKGAMFDSRVFNIPKEEVCNCFIWRQQDATRNAIQMLGQSQFSHGRLQNLSCNQIQELLWQEKDINFNDLPVYQKRGACVVKEHYDKEGIVRSRWVVDKDIPIFTKDRNYVEKYLCIENETD